MKLDLYEGADPGFRKDVGVDPPAKKKKKKKRGNGPDSAAGERANYLFAGIARDRAVWYIARGHTLAEARARVTLKAAAPFSGQVRFEPQGERRDPDDVIELHQDTPTTLYQFSGEMPDGSERTIYVLSSCWRLAESYIQSEAYAGLTRVAAHGKAVSFPTPGQAPATRSQPEAAPPAPPAADLYTMTGTRDHKTYTLRVAAVDSKAAEDAAVAAGYDDIRIFGRAAPGTVLTDSEAPQEAWLYPATVRDGNGAVLRLVVAAHTEAEAKATIADAGYRPVAFYSQGKIAWPGAGVMGLEERDLPPAFEKEEATDAKP